MLRVRLITALHMEVEGGVDTQYVQRLHVGSQDSALDMVEGRGAKWKDAVVVLRGRQGYASRMVEAAGASTQIAPREPKEALCTARPMEEAGGVCLQGVQRVPKGARHSARGMVGESVASMMEVASAPRVCMVGPTTVLPMEEGSVVLCQAV